MRPLIWEYHFLQCKVSLFVASSFTFNPLENYSHVNHPHLFRMIHVKIVRNGWLSCTWFRMVIFLISSINFSYGSVSKPCTLVNIKIAGKWMFIPLKIGIDPYPYKCYTIPRFTWQMVHGISSRAARLNARRKASWFFRHKFSEEKWWKMVIHTEKHLVRSPGNML